MLFFLKELPPEHPLRNTPLAQIGAERRNKLNKSWQSVANWKIGKNTFNELAPFWLETSEWRVER